MANKRRKEEELRRNVERLEKEVDQALVDERRRPAPEEMKAIAASAASDST